MKLGVYEISEYPYCYYDDYTLGFDKEKFDKENEWCYCVIGNIIPEHFDESDTLRYGTKAFPGGRKVYLSKSFWPEKGTITVMGLNRYKSKYTTEHISIDLITNIRRSKEYAKRPLEIMGDFEFCNTWWGNTPGEKSRADEFTAALKEYKELRLNKN